MTISPWVLLALSIPVLLLGEWLVRRVRWLYRFSIPEPVVGGLVIAAAVLVVNLVLSRQGMAPVTWTLSVDAAWWTWLGSVETAWWKSPRQDVDFTIMVAFFTCIGLNATWTVVKRGGWQLVWFLGISSALAWGQNFLGMGLAELMGESPHMGLLCGSVSLTGGPATVIGFSQVFQDAGYAPAAIVGTSAAVFGLVCGSVLGGPVGNLLVRRHRLHAPHDEEHRLRSEVLVAERHGFIAQARQLATGGGRVLLHLLIIAACIKAGAWVSLGALKALQSYNPQFSFPPYLGALFVGIAVRNVVDAMKRPIIDTDTVELIASVTLGVFLTCRMMGLNLILLRDVAGPMLVILLAQVVMTLLFAYYITFRAMGRNYDAAVMSSGQVGFALGATSNAVANMEALTNRYGPSPRAFLVVTTVGAFLIDIVNMLLVTKQLNAIGAAGP